MSAPTNHESVRVEVRGLRKSFADHEVLRGVSFTVERGEIFVLMGPSGSGKSVLLKHIIGLEEPDAGELLLEGQGIHTEGLRDRYRMAMVFQSGALLNSLTVGENVGLYLREHRLRPEPDIRRIIAEKLDIVGLKGTEEKIPAELSGGMKKRVALARALVIEPQLILYDEPTSELDPLIAITIGQEILALRERTHATSIVVTHDRDLAFGIADRIAMIADGEILEIGRPEDLRRSQHPLVRKFLTADFKPKP
ncbi:MAG: ATP-binding cassette domain-containing protein [Verrucomicrobia bacterium]|nr:ATP-binding cassette domain-containing protein [Verrucomicrobiota bacterium]